MDKPVGSEENYDEAWDAEIHKRSEEIHAGKVTGVPAAEVFAEVRRRHRLPCHEFSQGAQRFAEAVEAAVDAIAKNPDGIRIIGKIDNRRSS